MPTYQSLYPAVAVAGPLASAPPAHGLAAFFQGVKQIIVSCRNLSYQGKTFGVQFQDGLAVINDRTPHRFGLTVEQMALKFSLDVEGYTVDVDEWHAGFGPAVVPATEGSPLAVGGKGLGKTPELKRKQAED